MCSFYPSGLSSGYYFKGGVKDNEGEEEKYLMKLRSPKVNFSTDYSTVSLWEYIELQFTFSSVLML